MTPVIAVAWTPEADTTLGLPRFETPGAAGADLRANLPAPVQIAPGERAMIGTGLCFGIPQGYEVQVRPRSGLAWKHGVTVLNSPGTIDSDYRGEIKVVLINHGAETFAVEHGDRIAQMVVAPVVQSGFALGALDDTERASGGFGSTGVA